MFLGIGNNAIRYTKEASPYESKRRNKRHQSKYRERKVQTETSSQ